QCIDPLRTPRRGPMAMKTKSEYLDSLNDGRRIFADGEEVKDLTTHPQFATALELVVDGYDKHYQPGANASGPYFLIPHSQEELNDLLETLLGWDIVTVTTSQGLLALLTAAARMRSDHPESSQHTHFSLSHWNLSATVTTSKTNQVRMRAAPTSSSHTAKMN